jgi:hypothetical protein
LNLGEGTIPIKAVFSPRSRGDGRRKVELGGKRNSYKDDKNGLTQRRRARRERQKLVRLNPDLIRFSLRSLRLK